MSFPLYDTLKNELKLNPIQKITKDDKKLFAIIPNLDDADQEVIYSAIVYYCIMNDLETTYYPCNMEFDKNYPEIDIKNLPKELRNMLILFLRKLK